MTRRVILAAVLTGSIVIGSMASVRAQPAVTPHRVSTPHATATATADPLVIGPADHILYINRPVAKSTTQVAKPAVTPKSPNAIVAPAPQNKAPADAAKATPPKSSRPAAGNAKTAEPKLGLADHILYIRPPILKNAAPATVGGVVRHNPASAAAAATFGPPEPTVAGPAGKGPTPGRVALSRTTDGSDLESLNWSVMVYKSRHLLTVYYKGHFYQSYRAVFGRNLDHRAKIYAGDRRTPEGVYTIIRKYRSARFRWFLKLNYPNDVDWARFQDMEAHHLISVSAVSSPGSAIGIHGTDEPLLNEADINWTTGCISVDNSAISELTTLLPVGTLVIIKP